MAQSVEIPGRGVAEFPDEMLPDEIKGVIKKKFFQQPTPTPVPTTPGSSPVAVQERVPESPSAVAVESPKAAIPEGPWLDQPIVQAATIPQQESIIAQTGAGLYNSLARGTEALLTPRNVIMAPALAVKPFARLAEILFGSHALHDVPEAVKAGFAPGTTFQQGIESGGRAITDILFGTVMARGAVKGTFGEPGKISDIAPETTAVGEAAVPERPPVQPEPVAVHEPVNMAPDVNIAPDKTEPAASTKPAPEPAARVEPLTESELRDLDQFYEEGFTPQTPAEKTRFQDLTQRHLAYQEQKPAAARAEPVAPEPAAEAPVKERGAFADVFAKRAMQTPDEYLESLSQPERRGGTDADHLYQHKVAVRQALKEGDPVLASNVERYNLQPGAPKATSTKNAAVAAEQAGLEAAGRVEDFIPSDQALRSTAFGRGLAAEDTLSVPKTELRSSDAKVESRWKDATRTERSLFQRAKDAAISIKNEFTRADPYLDPKTDAPLIDTIRRFRTIPRHSQELAANIIRGFTAGLGKNKFEVYQRNVILNDLARDVEDGRYAGRELPFGYTPETLKADTVKFQELAKANPLVEQSLATRNKFMDTLKTELVENDLLPEQVLQEGDYFHRQVVDYLNAKDSFTTGIGTKDVRVGKKGFQRERTFSSKDYNTKYIEAEYEVISQALSQLRTKKTLAELKGSDIKPQLMEEAKAQGVNWEELIPDDHAIWQPKEGNVFYSTMTIPEKVIDGIFKGDRQLSKSDLREVLAMGGAREQWVVPKRLAKTLDNISPKTKDSFIDRMAQNITNGWKVWTLLNPVRSVKYGLNNLSGDLDISMAYSPKISAQYGPKAAKDMHRYVLKRGAMTPEVSEGIEKGVLSSGFSVTEVPDISSHQFFRAVTGEKPSLIDRFWQKNKDYHNWRENVLRLASWRFFKDKLANAKPGERFYAASRKSEIDGLYDAGVPSDQIAAKLARELIGDYGNISHAGQYIRTHAVPFYSWMEINAPRYVRLLKNAASEGEGNVAARAAGVIAKRTAFKAIGKTVKTGGLAAGMYTLVNLWNHTRFPQEEAELGEARRDLHLILGRNEDGSIKTLRVQGALSDALSFFGAEDLPSDIQDVATGKATIGEKAIEAVKAAPTKYISGVTPFVKTPVEALSKQSLFPDPFNPRPIRDSTEAIARMFSLDKPYQYFADKPMRPVMTEIANLVTYTTEPGEAAYHMTRGLVSKWQTKQGGEKSSIIPTKRQNALFYYKKATQLGETEKAERWKQRYMDMGGKEEGLAKSVAVSSPLGGLSQKRRTDFLNSLNPKEREIVDRADDWYTEIYGNTSTRKFKGF